MALSQDYLSPRLQIALVSLVVGAVTATVGTWVIGFRSRRRIKRALGRDANSADLVSLETWMNVEEDEQKLSSNSRNNPVQH